MNDEPIEKDGKWYLWRETSVSAIDTMFSSTLGPFETRDKAIDGLRIYRKNQLDDIRYINAWYDYR